MPVGIISFFGQPHVTTNVPNPHFQDLLTFVGTLTSSDRVYVDNSTTISTQVLGNKPKQNILFGFSPASKVIDGLHPGYAKKRGIDKIVDYRLSLIGGKFKLCADSYRVLSGGTTIYQDDRRREFTDIITVKRKINKDSNMIHEMIIHAEIYEETMTGIVNQCSCKWEDAPLFLDSVIDEFQAKPTDEKLVLLID